MIPLSVLSPFGSYFRREVHSLSDSLLSDVLVFWSAEFINVAFPRKELIPFIWSLPLDNIQ